MPRNLAPRSKELPPGAWTAEYLRQFTSLKAALHSLRLQEQDRRKLFGTAPSFTEMQVYFDAIEQAFEALNRAKPHKRERSPFLSPGGRYSTKTLNEELELLK